MIDFPSVSLSGAISISHARVLFKDGILRAFTKKGLVWEVGATEIAPSPKGWPVRWFATTLRGALVMKPKCETCCGWRKVTSVPAETLWSEGE